MYGKMQFKILFISIYEKIVWYLIDITILIMINIFWSQKISLRLFWRTLKIIELVPSISSPILFIFWSSPPQKHKRGYLVKLEQFHISPSFSYLNNNNNMTYLFIAHWQITRITLNIMENTQTLQVYLRCYK